jgi:hypothetical protein
MTVENSCMIARPREQTGRRYDHDQAEVPYTATMHVMSYNILFDDLHNTSIILLLSTLSPLTYLHFNKLIIEAKISIRWRCKHS